MTFSRTLARRLGLAVGLLAAGFFLGARWAGDLAQSAYISQPPAWVLTVKTGLAVSLWLTIGGLAIWLALDWQAQRGGANE